MAGPAAIGRVTYVTFERAYLDRGRDDGLAPGQILKLRQGRAKRTCKVEWVADTRATCVGAGVSVGDQFSVEAPAAPEPARKLPPLVGRNELERRLRVVSSSPLQLVRFAQQSLTRAHASRFALGHDSWAARLTGDGPFHGERFDLALQGVQLSGRLHAFVDLTVQTWARRPEGARMPQAPLAVLVRRAELATAAGGSFRLAAGRTRPLSAPGLVLLDGIQAGWRDGQNRELGGFAGTLPEPFMLTPSVERYTAGAYFRQQLVGEPGSSRAGQLETRLALVRTSAQGPRVEGEAAFYGQWLAGAHGHAQVRLATPTDRPQFLVESARADVSARPLSGVRLVAGARFLDAASFESPLLDASDRGRRSLHTDATLAIEPIDWLLLEARSGMARDLGSGLSTARVGGALGFRRTSFGVELGHDEEAGWLRGRTSYAETWVAFGPAVRLTARGSLFQQLWTEESAGLSGAEAGLYVAIDVRMGARTHLRSFGWLRHDVTPRRSDGPQPASVAVGSVTLKGEL